MFEFETPFTAEGLKVVGSAREVTRTGDGSDHVSPLIIGTDTR